MWNEKFRQECLYETVSKYFQNSLNAMQRIECVDFIFVVIRNTFAVSITDPPPTAMKESNRPARAKSIARFIPGEKKINFWHGWNSHGIIANSIWLDGEDEPLTFIRWFDLDIFEDGELLTETSQRIRYLSEMNSSLEPRPTVLV